MISMKKMLMIPKMIMAKRKRNLRMERKESQSLHLMNNSSNYC